MQVQVMRSYPRAKRNVDERAAAITPERREIARKFGHDFFDGDRLFGYGGYRYDGRWKPVVRDFVADYQLGDNARILDVGCAKGFMVRDFVELLPKATIRGVDISQYAIDNADPVAKPHLSVACASELPFPDKSFDLVIAINTIHNLELDGVKRALREVSRVSAKHAFVVLDAYVTEQDRERMMKWNLTAKTILSVDGWVSLFAEVGYTGDYDWFMP